MIALASMNITAQVVDSSEQWQVKAEVAAGAVPALEIQQCGQVRFPRSGLGLHLRRFCSIVSFKTNCCANILY